MRSPLRFARLFAAVFVAALTLAALPVFAQDVGVDPTDYLNFIPEKYRSLALAVLAGGYTVLIIARRFTAPTSKAGIFVRSILSGWKHPDELPGKLTPPPAAPAPAPVAPPKGFGIAPLLFVVAIVTGIVLWIFAPAYAHAAGMDELAAVSAQETDAALSADEAAFLRGARLETAELRRLTLLAQADTAGTGAAAGVQPAAPAAAPAQVAPATAPLAFDLGSSWGLTLRPNFAVVAFSYDITHKAYLGQAQIAGLGALTAAKLYNAGIAAGGAVAFDSSSKPSGSFQAGLVSPTVKLSPALSLHGAVLYGHRFGPDAANLVHVVPTLEF